MQPACWLAVQSFLHETTPNRKKRESNFIAEIVIAFVIGIIYVFKKQVSKLNISKK